MKKQNYTRGNKFRPKDIIANIYFDILDINLLKEALMKDIKFNVHYSFLLKIRRDDGGYGMAGEQLSFICDYNNYDFEIESLYSDLMDRIVEFKKEYFDCEILYMQLMFISIRSFPKLKLKNINKLKLDKQLVNISKTKEYFNNSILPLTLNDFYYGTRLKHTVDNLGIVQSVFIENTNFIDLVKQKSRLSNKEFSGDVIFYLYINDLGKQFVIVSMMIDSYHTKKEVYNINGNLIVIVYDYMINDVIFERSIRNTTLTVKNSSIAKLNIRHEFTRFKDNYIALKSIVNPNIGTFDIETYRHTRDGKSYVFSLGFKISKGEENKFFLCNNESSQSLILKCIDSMLISKYNGYTFYTHNFGGYDAIFILKALNDYNINIGDEYYKLDPLFRGNRLLRLIVKIKTQSGGLIKITFSDSYTLLLNSLYKLSKDFECEVTKGLYPYGFVNESNLYYIGETPDKVFYKKINDETEYDLINEGGKKKEIDECEYNSIKRSDWSLKDETMHYLSKDLNSLMCVIEKFNRYIYSKYDIQITNCLTIARLSLNIFLKHYLGESKLPLVKKENVFNFIKLGYYGGITEVYRPYCEKANYYDVNSLYPFASKNPIPGTESNYVEDFTKQGLNLDELFGYFYCRVKTNNLYIGLLPLHIDSNLILPNGEFYGIWFSEELKFAKKHGYDIHVIKGYNFNKVYNVFDNFVDELYDIKLNSEGSIKSITKLILNSLFGRLGMSINKSVTKIVNREKLELLSSTRQVKELYIQLSEDQYLVTYNTEISRSHCDKNELDIIKVLNEEKRDHEDHSGVRDVSISTAAAVTSYARIYMNKIKILILSLGGKIYYMDTDSIVTDILLPEYLVGNKLGQFKLEHIIQKGYFISSKTYCLNNEKGQEVIKAKGIKTKTLKSKDFENMYYNNFDVEAIKTYSQINYGEGYVTIDETTINLNHDAYTKREKIYENGVWIDTKPLVILSENKNKIK